MSTTSGSGGSAAPQEPVQGGPPPPNRWWRTRRLRWVSLGGLAVAVAGVVLGVTLTAGSAAAAAPAVGSLAPGGSFTTVSGQAENLSPRGQPTLVWLMTTWCPVCQAGTRAMTASLASRLAQMHVRVLELELHGDLGHSSPTMAAFIRQYAGAGPHNPDWTFGMASSALTQAYNPKGMMDIYYLVDSSGHVRYINSGPAATGPKLLAHVAALS